MYIINTYNVNKHINWSHGCGKLSMYCLCCSDTPHVVPLLELTTKNLLEYYYYIIIEFIWEYKLLVFDCCFHLLYLYWHSKSMFSEIILQFHVAVYIHRWNKCVMWEIQGGIRSPSAHISSLTVITYVIY